MNTVKSLSLVTGSVALAFGLLAGSSSISFAQTAAATALSTTATAPMAAAAAPQPERGGYMKMLKQMGLTTAQEAQIKPLMKSQKTQIEAIKANTALTDKERKQQMRQVHESTLASVRADLNPAQQQTLDTYIAQQKADRKAARTVGQP